MERLPPIWKYKPLAERRRGASRPPSVPQQTAAAPLCRSASATLQGINRGERFNDERSGRENRRVEGEREELWESSRELGARIAAFLHRTEVSSSFLPRRTSSNCLISDRSLSLASQAEEDESEASTLSGHECSSVSKEYASSRTELNLKREVDRLRRELKDTEARHSDYLSATRKTYDRKLTDTSEELEEQRGLVMQLKRCQSRLTAQLDEMRLSNESAAAAAATAQRRLAKAEEAASRLGYELREEREERERILFERDNLANKAASFERALADAEADVERKDYVISRLNEELRDTQETAAADSAATAAQIRNRHEVARKHLMADVEEARTQLQTLEQTKLRLERESERLRLEARKQASAHAEEVEQLRVSTQKKIRGLESELENERGAKNAVVRERAAVMRKLASIEEEASARMNAAGEREKRLRRRSRRLRARLAVATASTVETAPMDPRPLRRLAAQVELVEDERRALAKALRIAEADLSEARASADAASAAVAESNRRVGSALRERESMSNRIDSLEQILNEVERENRILTERAAVRDTENAVAKERSERLTAEMNVQVEEVRALRARVDLLTQLVDAATVEAEENRRDTAEATAALAADRILITRLEGEIEDARNEHERTIAERTAAAERDSQTQDSLRNLRREMQALRDDKRSLADQLGDTTSQQRETERRMVVAEAENTALKGQLRSAIERASELQLALTSFSAVSSESDDESYAIGKNLASEDVWSDNEDSPEEYLVSNLRSRSNSPCVA